MKKKTFGPKPILVTLVLCARFVCFSQAILSLEGAGDQHDLQAWSARNGLRNFNEPEGFVGDIYLGGGWLNGTIITKDGVKLSNTQLKYDMQSGILIAKLEERRTPFVLKSELVSKFIITNNGIAMIFKTEMIEDKPIYLQMLYEGKSKLLVEHSAKKISRDQGNQAYGSGVAYDKYVPQYEYFALVQGELIPFKPTKKNLILLLEDHAEPIKNYIKESKLNLKSKPDLVSVFKYYDELQNERP